MAQPTHNCTPDFLLFVVAETLSDRSVAYNVVFGEHKFSATSLRAAKDMAEAIADAINDNSVNMADVIYEA